jgi:hypothetical protein
MKKVKLSAVKKINGLNKAMMQDLFNGKKMTSITDQNEKLGMWAKVTELIIDQRFYYGMWEKDMFEDRWNLLHFGEQPEIEPIWDEYIAYWTKKGYIKGKIAA